MSRSVGQKTFGVIVLGTTVLTISLCVKVGGRSTNTGKPADPSLIDRRLWVESRPEKLTDYVNAVVFVSHANFGVFDRSSSYEGRFEVFDMTRDTTSIKLTFPQSGKSAGIGFAVKTCDDVKPFDLCLELSKNPWGGPRRYRGFSRPEEEAAALQGISRAMRQFVGLRGDSGTLPPGENNWSD